MTWGGKQERFGSGIQGFGMPGVPAWGDFGGWDLAEEVLKFYGLNLFELGLTDEEVATLNKSDEVLQKWGLVVKS